MLNASDSWILLLIVKNEKSPNVHLVENVFLSCYKSCLKQSNNLKLPVTFQKSFQTFISCFFSSPRSCRALFLSNLVLESSHQSSVIFAIFIEFSSIFIFIFLVACPHHFSQRIGKFLAVLILTLVRTCCSCSFSQYRRN